jgi:hypothetical protein
MCCSQAGFALVLIGFKSNPDADPDERDDAQIRNA